MTTLGKNVKQVNITYSKKDAQAREPADNTQGATSNRISTNDSLTSQANILYQTAKANLEQSGNLKTSIRESVATSLAGLFEIILKQNEELQNLKLQMGKETLNRERELRDKEEIHNKQLTDLTDKLTGMDVRRRVDEVLTNVETVRKIISFDVVGRLDNRETAPGVLSQCGNGEKVDQLIGEVKELRNVTDEVNEKVMEIMEKGVERDQSYAGALNAPRPTIASVTQQRPKHAIIISSTVERDTGNEVMGKVREVLNARENGWQIERVRKVKNQRVVLSCGNKDDLSRMESRLKTNDTLRVEQARSRDPLVIIRNLFNYNEEKDIVDSLRKQNKRLWEGMAEEDFRVKEKYRRRARNPHQCHVVLQLSPQMWSRMRSAERIHIDIQGLVAEDQSPLVQCMKCLGYGHGRRYCEEKEDLCCMCGGTHLRAKCPKAAAGETPKCRNCEMAGIQDTAHTAFSDDCPVKKKWDVIARSSVSYC